MNVFRNRRLTAQRVIWPMMYARSIPFRSGWCGVWLAAAACALPRLAAATEAQVMPPPAGAELSDAGSASTATAREGAWRISIDEAILLGLERNRSLRVERYRPVLAHLREGEEQARFDASVSAGFSSGRESVTRSGLEEIAAETLRRQAADLDIARRFGSGTTAGVEADWRVDDRDSAPDLHRVRVGVRANQALLQGLGSRADRAAIEQARLDTRASLHELRGFTEALVAEIESVCWDYALAVRRIDIVRESAGLAEQQLREVERRIEVGALAETERAAARAELAMRREALINARSAAEALRYRILRLLDPGGDWSRPLSLVDEPDLPPVSPERDPPRSNVERALSHRPELLQARLAVERGELDVVRTRDGLLPRLDLFIRLGRTAYAEAFSDAVSDADGHTDWSAGVRLETPLGRRAERARHARSQLSLEQTREAVRNLEGLVRLDVLTAALEVERATEQISATAVTRVLQEETLRAEEQKFRVGRSTSLLVAQAQRDVMASRIAEVEAVAVYLKARVRLYRLEGTLLDRLGIAVFDDP